MSENLAVVLAGLGMLSAAVALVGLAVAPFWKARRGYLAKRSLVILLGGIALMAIGGPFVPPPEPPTPPTEQELAEDAGFDDVEAWKAGMAAGFEDGASWRAHLDELAEAGRVAAEEAACRADLQCWGDRHWTSAAAYCEGHIEALAQWDVEWDAGLITPMFSRWRWLAGEPGPISFFGDRVKFQNGFGAWSNMIYRCDFDPDTKEVLQVDAEPGRYPN